MARVTIEDCAKRIPNRFELCMIAAQRVREMDSGAPSVSPDVDSQDKPCVVALKEIASDRLNYSVLKEMLIKNMRSHSYLDDATDSALSTQDESEIDQAIDLEIEDGLIFSGDEDGFTQDDADEQYDDIEEDSDRK